MFFLKVFMKSNFRLYSNKYQCFYRTGSNGIERLIDDEWRKTKLKLIDMSDHDIVDLGDF